MRRAASTCLLRRVEAARSRPEREPCRRFRLVPCLRSKHVPPVLARRKPRGSVDDVRTQSPGRGRLASTHGLRGRAEFPWRLLPCLQASVCRYQDRGHAVRSKGCLGRPRRQLCMRSCSRVRPETRSAGRSSFSRAGSLRLPLRPTGRVPKSYAHSRSSRATCKFRAAPPKGDSVRNGDPVWEEIGVREGSPLNARPLGWASLPDERGWDEFWLTRPTATDRITGTHLV